MLILTRAHAVNQDNYRRCGNFSRMKLQATSALSRLVGESAEIVPEQFQHSLSTVAEFAQQDKSMPDTFKTQVSELMNRLFSVLRSSKEKEEYAYDPEKTADLYYDISKGYIASPDLRATWLSNLAIYQESVRYLFSRFFIFNSFPSWIDFSFFYL